MLVWCGAVAGAGMFAGFLQKGISVTTEVLFICCVSVEGDLCAGGGVRHEDFCDHKGVVHLLCIC